MNTIEIRRPLSPKEWDDYYALRYRVLREPLGQPVGSERNDGDLNGEHFALYDNGFLKAIARLDESDEKTAQVRFVAVDNTVQQKRLRSLNYGGNGRTRPPKRKNQNDSACT